MKVRFDNLDLIVIGVLGVCLIALAIAYRHLSYQEEQLKCEIESLRIEKIEMMQRHNEALMKALHPEYFNDKEAQQ